ncbi:uncharacterized protein [Rutidosis leptorrhynchoides]|uniref:uncharacterized protein n=1 Tax=Rutidosis leptorrhynchoides TaxID=125765 RepID=UPI003A98DC5A
MVVRCTDGGGAGDGGGGGGDVVSLRRKVARVDGSQGGRKCKVLFISSIYGISGGLLVDDSFRTDSYKSVWNEIVKISNHINTIGLSFRNSFVKDLGDGGSTSFWNDSWIGGETLKGKFKRLSRLENDINVSVKDRVIWDGAKGVGNWSWTREPFGWARDELHSLTEMISGAVFNPEKEDSWRWAPGGNGMFTTKFLSDMITSRLLPISDLNGETSRNKLVPKKVEVFVWRARKLRLPVLLELDKRGIELHSVRCPLCDDDIETVNHSLILCKNAFEVWAKIFDWWGRGGVPFINVGDLFLDTGQATSHVGKIIWQAVVWTCSYLIWKIRNQKIFTNKSWNGTVALNEIQVKSFEWFAKRCKDKSIDWHN